MNEMCSSNRELLDSYFGGIMDNEARAWEAFLAVKPDEGIADRAERERWHERGPQACIPAHTTVEEVTSAVCWYLERQARQGQEYWAKTSLDLYYLAVNERWPCH
jgi:hypothetical protein